MPPEAKVFIVEDDPSIIGLYKIVLPRAGHTIVSFATDYRGAMEEIDVLEEGEVDVMITDGNLSWGRSDSAEGNAVISRMREAHPKVKIIGISSVPGSLRGADRVMDKSGLNFRDVADAVTKI